MKKRSLSHLIDAAGIKILEDNLPPEWVPRQYKPDYGIDFNVEVFDYAGTDLVSLGEHFFIQLKSTQKIEIKKRTVFGRQNIEKQPFTENKDDKSEINVIPFPLDVSDLELARSMGAALPILLVLCNTSTNDTYFLCLNDYVDKVIIPQDPSFPTTKTKTVYVPTWNRISRNASDTIPLRFFAQRAKLYAAFNKFKYQNHELQYSLGHMQYAPPDELRTSNALVTVSVFLELVKGYDFWETTYAWPAIELMWRMLIDFEARLNRFKNGEDLQAIYRPVKLMAVQSDNSIGDFSTFLLLNDIQITWDQLANLGNMFEEICREWFLPTHLAALADQHALRV